MANKGRANEIQEQFKRFLRYTVRFVPIIMVVFAIAWFFLLRSPGDQTNTAGTTKTKETTSKPAEDKVISATQPETKVADNSAAEESSKTEEDEGKEGKLPETGPSDNLATFAAATIAGTLFWELRLRRARQRS